MLLVLARVLLLLCKRKFALTLYLEHFIHRHASRGTANFFPLDHVMRYIYTLSQLTSSLLRGLSQILT